MGRLVLVGSTLCCLFLCASLNPQTIVLQVVTWTFNGTFDDRGTFYGSMMFSFDPSNETWVPSNWDITTSTDSARHLGFKYTPASAYKCGFNMQEMSPMFGCESTDGSGNVLSFQLIGDPTADSPTVSLPVNGIGGLELNSVAIQAYVDNGTEPYPSSPWLN